MRKLLVLLAAAGFLLGITGSAQAGPFDPQQSTLSLPLAAIPVTKIPALPGSASVVAISGTVGNHSIAATGVAWSTVNFGPGTAIFTGVPLITNLKITVKNDTGTLADGFAIADNNIGGGESPTFGGMMRFNGQAIVYVGGGPVAAVGLSAIGGNIGDTSVQAIGSVALKITGGGPFRAGKVTITGITTNVITIPNRGNKQGVWFSLQPTANETVMTPTTNGGFVSTATVAVPIRYQQNAVMVSGTKNLLSAAETQDGTVTVIAPIRVQTGLIAGAIPGRGGLSFVFVPEPGTMLLLVSGAVGLAVIGRRRMRK